MEIGSIISNQIPELRISDTIEQALHLMEEFKVEHLPVVKDGILLGTISESSLMNATQDHVMITGLELFQTAIEPQQHLYEVIEMMAEQQLTLVPVTDSKGYYLGTITAMAVVNQLARTQALASKGSIVVLEMNSRDYSLAEISRLAESNGILILSSMLTTIEDSTKSELSLKLNKQDIEAFMQTLSRYDYKVKAFFKAPDSSNDLQRRYEEFLRYLNT